VTVWPPAHASGGHTGYAEIARPRKLMIVAVSVDAA
jgi:hypothetical protein